MDEMYFGFLSLYNNANQYDDYNNNQYNNNQQADDAGQAGYDDYFKHADDDAYINEKEAFYNKDDDTFHWNANVGFDGVSVMPISCIN